MELKISYYIWQKFLSEDFGVPGRYGLYSEMDHLLSEYEKYATLYSLSGIDHQGEKATAIARQLKNAGHSAAICNTTVTGLFVATLKKFDFFVATLIHELPEVIKSYGLEKHVKSISEYSDKIVFPAAIVRQGFESFTKPDSGKVQIRTQGIYKPNKYKTAHHQSIARKDLRARFGLPGTQKNCTVCRLRRP